MIIHSETIDYGPSGPSWLAIVIGSLMVMMAAVEWMA